MSHPQLMLSALCRGLRADKETDRKKAMKDLSEVVAYLKWKCNWYFARASTICNLEDLVLTFVRLFSLNSEPYRIDHRTGWATPHLVEVRAASELSSGVLLSEQLLWQTKKRSTLRALRFVLPPFVNLSSFQPFAKPWDLFAITTLAL